MEELTAELFDGNIANITKVSGYMDGIDGSELEVIFRVNDEPYPFNITITRDYTGSKIENTLEIVKELHRPIKKRDVVDVERLTYDFDQYDAIPREQVAEEVQTMYENFIKSGAKEMYRYYEYEDDNTATFECFVDHNSVSPVCNGWKKKYVEGIFRGLEETNNER